MKTDNRHAGAVSPTRVVVDTNIIIDAGYKLDKGDFSRFLDRVSRSVHSLHIPRVVVDEAENHWRRELANHKKSIDEQLKAIKGISGQEFRPVSDADIDSLAHQYTERLVNRISAAGATLWGYPTQPSHQEVLQRCHAGKSPFGKKGQAGYPDFLIWQTVLHMAGERTADRIALITRDSDFCGDKGELHPDLGHDLQRAGLPRSLVILFKSLERFMELLETPREKADRERALADLSQYPAFKWQEQVREHMPEFILSYWSDHPEGGPTAIPTLEELRACLRTSSVLPLAPPEQVVDRLVVRVAATAKVGFVSTTYPVSTTQSQISWVAPYEGPLEPASVYGGQWAGIQMARTMDFASKYYRPGPILELGSKEFRVVARVTFQPPSGPTTVDLEEEIKEV